MNALRKLAVARARYEKVVIVTRLTPFEELLVRFNTAAQARFYLGRLGQDLAPLEAAHARYHGVLDGLRGLLPRGLKQHSIERGLLPQYQFGDADLVVTVGPDGLVVNTAKYLDGQPLLAVNPDPQQIDGVLLPFSARQLPAALAATLAGALPVREVSMAEARLADGQRLLGFNDLFIGARSHVSARYRIETDGRAEEQSSSGIIVSTGAGSTGWLRSVYAGAAGVVQALGGQVSPPPDGGRFAWDAGHLVYAVREPFPSRTSRTGLVYGTITPERPLRLISRMAENGVIFSDGMEADFLRFDAGAEVLINLAGHKARLVAPAVDRNAAA